MLYKRSFKMAGAAAFLIMLFAVGFSVASSAVHAQTTNQAATSPDRVGALQTPGFGTDAYKLDTGDKIKITVYGEDDLSGDFDVDGSGNVRLPLVGPIQAAGLTLHEFEVAIGDQLKAKNYLVNPQVNAEVENYRPFTILGEINKPGEYAFENGMTVLNAVAIGGGYTLRADKDEVYVRRKDSSTEIELPADERTKIFPGDTVRVTERIF